MQIGILQERYWVNTLNGYYEVDESYRAEVCADVFNVAYTDLNMVLVLSPSTLEAYFVLDIEVGLEITKCGINVVEVDQYIIDMPIVR